MGDLAEGHWSLVEFFETSLRQELRDLDVGVLHMWSDWKELDICSLNEPPMLPVVFCVLPVMYTGSSTIIVLTSLRLQPTSQENMTLRLFAREFLKKKEKSYFDKNKLFFKKKKNHSLKKDLTPSLTLFFIC